MKKLLLIVWLCGSTLALIAQEKVMKITPVKKGEEPQQVMEAIKKDFPEAVSKDLAFLPTKIYGDEWNVEVTGDDVNELNFYEIDLIQGKNHYAAVYNKDGKLLSSKEIIRSESPPSVVNEAIGKFKGWKMDKFHETIRYRNHKTTDTYKIKLHKGAEHKVVFIDPKGEIINTRFVLF